MESVVLRAFEDASRTTEACFAHRISLPYRRSLFFTPNASENASRTVGSLFEHGTHIPYHRRAFPVPSPQRRAAAAAELRTSQKNEADHDLNMFLAPFDLLVAVDPMVGANMARGPWAAYAAGSLSSTYA